MRLGEIVTMATDPKPQLAIDVMVTISSNLIADCPGPMPTATNLEEFERLTSSCATGSFLRESRKK
jgi:hypothetical protein